MSAAPLPVGHPHRRQPRPAGPVGRGRDRRAAHRGVAAGREHHHAVDDGGQHVDGDLPLVEPQPLLVGARRQRHRRIGLTCRQIADHDHRFESARGNVPRWAAAQQPVGHRQPRGLAALRVPVDDRGHRTRVGLDAKRHSRIRPVRVTARAAQQPAVHPPLLGARPRQRGGMLGRADLRRPHRRCRQGPHRDDVVGARSPPPHRFSSARARVDRFPAGDRSRR